MKRTMLVLAIIANITAGVYLLVTRRTRVLGRETVDAASVGSRRRVPKPGTAVRATLDTAIEGAANELGTARGSESKGAVADN